ncbi:MAG: peptide chain release factor 3, partial [Betaproteobacteria bacterium]|nr:peptide chain release factor 3 [Betaproteobacteria bacterium]
GDEIITDLNDAAIQQRFGLDLTNAQQEIELIEGASPEFVHNDFLAGTQTPVFFGSAINNFGVREILDALVDLAPPPESHHAIQREVIPDEKKFSGMVFKIQANMNPAHRDRIAFVRICSGQFKRGMTLKVSRSSKDIRTSTVVSFLSQRRDLLEEAFPGDIIGIPNHGTLQLGDTLTEGETLQFTGLPFFAPEIFRTVEITDPLRSKQLKLGLTQLGEEGAIQVFRPYIGNTLLLGAVGVLQFEVVTHRLQHEYAVAARIAPAKYQLARWVTSENPRELQRFIDANTHRIAYDAVGAPTFLASFGAELSVAEENWPEIQFHKLREHAGLVFQTHMGN